MPTTTLHRLPCSIKHRGEARVTNFFKVATEESKSDSSCNQDGGMFEIENDSQRQKFKSQFQGQCLEGYKVKLEEIGTGFIVESQGDCIESVQAEQSPLKVIDQFDSFILWNRTLESGIHDNLRESVENWPKIATLIHDPIE
mmetsp:Transcript_30753/g.42851  ORF Transcript_30753/g.42851 Transcript_30753/m.42851 type:complete len:142 (+) Transcript_30753:2-427(+)